MSKQPSIWFPTVKTNTGTDVFTERLADGLNKQGIRAEITWLPLRAEYAPWTVPVPPPPPWADIAHVNTWLHSRFLPRQLPVIASVHHSIPDPALRPYKGLARATYHRWWIAPNERRVMQRANRVVAVSEFAANIARETLTDVPMEVIYNGIDTQQFSLPLCKDKPHQPFRLLYVGSWKALKGVDLLAPIMRDLGDGFELRYTGGPAAKHDKWSMPANMHDLGRLQGTDAVIAAMHDADAFLFPSRSEGFGLVAAEAMACGLPVVATRGSSLAELIECGSTGILCDTDSVVGFVSAIKRLRADKQLLQWISNRAKSYAVTEFDQSSFLSKYQAVYLNEQL